MISWFCGALCFTTGARSFWITDLAKLPISCALPAWARKARKGGLATLSKIGDGMGRRKQTRGARKVRKNVPYGQAHVHATFNNTIVSMSDQQGNVITWASAGTAGFKGHARARLLPQAPLVRWLQQASSTVCKKLISRRPGPGRGRHPLYQHSGEGALDYRSDTCSAQRLSTT
jgi:small subunit ribosomal protein S11